MGITARNVPDVHKRILDMLGLSSRSDLASPEALAANLRRAAALHCPASPTTLVRAVIRSLRDLVPDLEAISEQAQQILEAMTAYGDLLETRDVSGADLSQRPNLVYAAPPAFVMRDNGSALLLGIAADRVAALPDDLEPLVRFANHTRRLPASIADLRDRLRDYGLLDLSHAAWLKCPTAEPAEALIARLDRQLEACQPLATGIDGLTVIDPSKPVTYYRGRWIDKIELTGKFVGRRPQVYGADLWVYVELKDGRPQRFIDLPLAKSRFRGCDEAWHIQAAIDAIQGVSQHFQRRTSDDDFVTMDFFSPLPMWAVRRLDAIGERVPPTHCLLSYRIPRGEADEECAFLHRHLWMIDSTGTASKD